MYTLNVIDTQEVSSYFAWIVGILGVIGTVVTLIAYLKSIKNEKINNYLFELAKKNIDKNIKKEELELLTKNVNTIQKQIEKSIPIEARKAVLKNKLNEEIQQLTKNYHIVLETKKQLEPLLENIIEIPNDILKQIETEINPKFIKEERLKSLKTYLTLLTAISAVISAAFPFPIDKISFIILLFTIPIISKMIGLMLPEDVVRRETLITKIKIYLCLFPSLILIVVDIIILINQFYINRENSSNSKFVMWYLLISTLIIFVLFICIFVFKIKDNKKRKGYYLKIFNRIKI